MIRKFKLINEKGQEFSLMNIEKYCLLTEPSGLGYSYSTKYEQVENNFLTNLRKLEQGVIAGSANFLYYDNFMNFGNFIESAKKLQFVYSIPCKEEEKIFYRDVNIKSLGKSEKQTDGVISEEIEFECLSLWYEQNETIFKIETYEDEMRYNYKWNSRYIDYNTRAIQFNNRGHVEAPFQVEIDGFVQNPTISIFVEDEEYASLKIPITINEYEKLLFSSVVGNIYIQKQNTDGTKENLWKRDYININNQNVFKLPLGVSEIRLTADDDVLNAKLTIFPQYKVV